MNQIEPVKRDTPLNYVVWLFKAAKNEAKRQPIGFVLSLLGGVALVYSAIQALPALFWPTDVQAVDLGFVLKTCGFVVVQGVLGAVYARTMTGIIRLGPGLPVILLLLVTIIACWLSGFITFWLSIPGATSGSVAGWAFGAGSTAAFFLFLYFIDTYGNQAIAAGQKESVFILPQILFALAFISTSIYFAVQAYNYVHR